MYVCINEWVNVCMCVCVFLYVSLMWNFSLHFVADRFISYFSNPPKLSLCVCQCMCVCVGVCMSLPNASLL